MDVVESVKFLYASDLRLDRPLALGEGASSAFTTLARDVAYEATRRLADYALSRRVDFVLLRGELCDAHCGARALLFLVEQMKRLSDAGIDCHILNEASPFDDRWLAEFPSRVKWLNSGNDVLICKDRSFSLALLLEPVPPPLQGLSYDENGPGGAWFVSLPGNGEPEEREFIELNALRWESRELDVTAIETEEDLAVSWKTVRDSFREREHEPAGGCSVLLRLKLSGAIKERSLFYGTGFMRDPRVLMKKLNADEATRKNFVMVDSLEDNTLSPAQRPLPSADAKEENAKRANALEADFWEEMAFFRSGIDLRVGLLDALKERSFLKRVLASDAAPFLKNITEADVESLLKESCDAAVYGLFKDGGGPK